MYRVFLSNLFRVDGSIGLALEFTVRKNLKYNCGIDLYLDEVRQHPGPSPARVS